jgi:hypothetical protein
MRFLKNLQYSGGITLNIYWIVKILNGMIK